MDVQAELSLYPLKTGDLDGAIGRFVERLEGRGLTVTPGPMSTRIAGDGASVFDALADAFAAAADRDEVVLVAKVSNACPTDSAT